MRWAFFATWVLATACTDDASIRTEVVPLASGNYYGVSWGGSQLQRFFAVARPGVPTDRTPVAKLISPEHSEPCTLGDDIWNYIPLQPRTAGKYVVGSPSPVEMMLFHDLDMDQFGTLTFADIQCQSLGLDIPDVTPRFRWYLYDPDLVNMKFALLNRDQKLLFVDPWRKTQDEVAQGVTNVFKYDQGLVLIEGGRVVVRDNAGKELSHHGDNVSTYVPLGSHGDLAFIDDKGVFALRNNKLKQIGPEGSCGPIAPIDGFQAGSIAYFSPCDSQRLVIANVLTDKHYEYMDNVDSRFGSEAGTVIFTIHNDDKMQLWIGSAEDPGNAKMVTERDAFDLAGFVAPRPGVLLIVMQETDGTYNVNAVSLGDPVYTLTPIVEQLSGYPQLTSDAVAVSYKSGEVTVLDRDLTHVILQLNDTHGSYNSFVFNGKATGFAYLSNFDTDTRLGRLELHLLNGDHFIFGDDVREFGEVWWPERGLVFTRGGDQPGVYFGRVDIPCEATSDTAWACGF
jgi:hypothetical protein